MLFRTDEYQITYYTTNDGKTVFDNRDHKAYKAFDPRTYNTPVFNWKYWPGEEPDWKPVDHSTDLITVYAPQEYTIPTNGNPAGYKITFHLYKIHTIMGNYYVCDTDGPKINESVFIHYFDNVNNPDPDTYYLNYILRSAYRDTWATLKTQEGTPVDRNQSPETNPVKLHKAPEII